MDTVLLQPWVTVRSDATAVATIIQDEEEWVDLCDHQDAVFWIDVREVAPGAPATLTLEASPTKDDVLFQPVTAPLALVASATPTLVKTIRTPSFSPMVRWLRWKLTTTGSGTWGASLRIRIALTRQSFFVPTQLSGCLLWLRGDLGLTQSGGVISAWADQSGTAFNCSATGSPGYATSAVNGFPAMSNSDGTSRYVATAATFAYGNAASVFAAVQPSVSPQPTYAPILELTRGTGYFLGFDSAGTHLQAGASTGNVTATYSAATTVIVGFTYAPMGTALSLYVNGVPTAGTGATPVSATNQTVYVGGNATNSMEGYLPELIFYNRALTVSEAILVQRYLGGRYGVSVQ